MRTPTVDFVGRSRRWALVSGVLLLLALGALGVRGLDLSIDFVGGNSYQLGDVADDLTADDLRVAAESAGAADVVAQLQLQRGGGRTDALVRTEALAVGGELEQAVRLALTDISGAAEVDFNAVGPQWGQRITRQALEALVVFLIVITIYITVRLEFKMALAALVALVHDVVITIGLYALVGFTVSPATVIALLTILGYSLYDTVVVFDRVKENGVNLGDPGFRTYAELVNASMNQVLWRSVNTSITSLLPVGSLLIIGAQVFGATTLQDLALALFIGMAVGIYSSLFVAGPVVARLKLAEDDERRRALRAERSDRRGAEPPTGKDAPAPGSPEARAPITTEYVRGQGRRGRRRR